MLLQFRGDVTEFDITSSEVNRQSFTILLQFRGDVAEFDITSSEVSRQRFTILLQFRGEVLHNFTNVYVIDRM
jgi:hypothetical protein